MWHFMNGNKIACGLGALAGIWAASPAFGQSQHAYNDNYYRGRRNIFITQGIESEWGRYVTTMKPDEGAQLTDDKSVEKKGGWTGFGIRNEAGMEVMRFVRVGMGHTFVNMRNRSDSQEKLTGSRLNAEARLVFDAPVCNLELGLGAIGSKLDYQRQLETADFISTGFYTTYSLNYFMTPAVSMFMQYKSLNENLRPEKGAKSVEKINAQTDNVGLGFSIWI